VADHNEYQSALIVDRIGFMYLGFDKHNLEDMFYYQVW